MAMPFLEEPPISLVGCDSFRTKSGHLRIAQDELAEDLDERAPSNKIDRIWSANDWINANLNKPPVGFTTFLA
jgi:hypothetical protein